MVKIMATKLDECASVRSLFEHAEEYALDGWCVKSIVIHPRHAGKRWIVVYEREEDDK